MEILRSELFALTAALLWAVSASLLENLTHRIPPKELNILKGSIAIVLLLGTSIVLGEDLSGLNWSVVRTLLLSGVIGIGLGDTAYFYGLKDIGSRRALLLFALAPPMTALIGWIFLGEALPLISWVGIFITVGGVAWVVTERTPQEKSDQDKKVLARGILLGTLASLGQAIGLVLSRSVMTIDGISSLQSAALRLAAGVIFTLGWKVVSRERLGSWMKEENAKQTWELLCVTAFVGTYLCLWLQQMAVQGAPAGIAQTLLSTSPIFILPISALRGEKVSWRAVLGASISILGVMLVFGLVG
ncbi:MAG TPA: EamA family transporter [Anaerolineaceae bacterium]|nr:EamA family transporter [Anaerolineaceae bacterium]